MSDATTLTPYDRVMDVNVVMDLARPRHKAGLGNLLILNAITADNNAPVSEDPISTDEALGGLLLRKVDSATNAVYREYKTIDAVQKDYPIDSDVWKKASAYFAQDNCSDRVAVLNLDLSKAYQSLQAFWYFNWTFAVFSKNPSNDDLKTVSNIFETNKNRFLVIQGTDADYFKAVLGQNYTIGIYHTGDQAIDAAWIGDTANLQVGSVTWKFRNLNGIDPDVLTSTELHSLEDMNVQAYVAVLGRNQTTEGKAMSGEYIDILHGILWVQTEMQTKLEELLQNNDRIPYEQKGINMILATGTQVLEEAWENGIILTNDSTGIGDYSITAEPRDEQSAEDLSNRHYGGLRFTYHAGSAIHSITVHGTVNSDTILQA